MEYPRIIAPGDVHRGRNENQQPDVDNNLDRAVFDLKDSVVRLKSDFGEGGPTHGTGFFVNFPSNKYDVILTAAHNLINHKRLEVLSLKVICARDKKNSQKNGEESKKDEEVSEDVAAYKICPKYKELLENKPNSPELGSHDYGVILLHKDNEKASNRQGLGLSLRLSSHTSLQGAKEVRVSGYGAGDDPNAPPKNSSGPLKIGGKQYLEYRAPTEQGMSGSPVWVPYGGHPMVVGIHNMRPNQKQKNAGSRGTKITEEVFRTICLWLEIGFFGKRLCAVGGKAKSHNTYFSFFKNSDFAKVFLGSKEEASKQDNVTFDIMPATVFPRWVDKSALYAFKFHNPPTWSNGKKCWVEWQPTQQRAVLVDTLKDVNLVRILDGMGKSKQRIIILIPMPGDKIQYQELRLYDDDRDEDDIEDGMTEFAGVSFGGWGEKQNMIGNRLLVIE